MFSKKWMIRAWTRGMPPTELREAGFPLAFRTRWAATRNFRAYSTNARRNHLIRYTVERIP